MHACGTPLPGRLHIPSYPGTTQRSNRLRRTDESAATPRRTPVGTLQVGPSAESIASDLDAVAPTLSKPGDTREFPRLAGSADEHRAASLRRARGRAQRDAMLRMRLCPPEGFLAHACDLRKRWALRVSNPRPSPCKGDALPAELSARFRGGVAARPADHVAELDRQPRAAARGAPVQAVGPSRLRLTRRADQYLPPAGHRSCPRHRTLVGVVGRTAASPACRSIHRLVGSVERPHVARIQGHTHPFPHVD